MLKKVFEKKIKALEEQEKNTVILERLSRVISIRN